MPIYTYSCPIHETFELEHSIKEKVEECPKCKEDSLPPQQLTRLINKTTFILNGGGWAKEGYS